MAGRAGIEKVFDGVLRGEARRPVGARGRVGFRTMIFRPRAAQRLRDCG
jgi:hypothetical protein